MADKKKENVEKTEETFDFNSLSEEEKLKEFESLKENLKAVSDENGVLKTLLKASQDTIDELTEKSKGKVSDDTYMRLAADFDNYKRRNQLAVSSAYTDGKCEPIIAFLAVVDNIERAIDSVVDESSKKGFELIKKQCDDVLSKLGVVEIEALGKPFDPNLHNAVMQCEARDESETDTCVEVFSKGYTLGDKVLRYSFVKVAK